MKSLKHGGDLNHKNAPMEARKADSLVELFLHSTD